MLGAYEELRIIDEIYCLVENKSLDNLTLSQIDRAAQDDDIQTLKLILERLR